MLGYRSILGLLRTVESVFVRRKATVSIKLIFGFVPKISLTYNYSNDIIKYKFNYSNLLYFKYSTTEIILSFAYKVLINLGFKKDSL